MCHVPQLVITDLGLLQPDPETCELVMTSLHPGVTRDECTAATGWPLRFAHDLSQTALPTPHEIETLREIQAA